MILHNRETCRTRDRGTPRRISRRANPGCDQASPFRPTPSLGASPALSTACPDTRYRPIRPEVLDRRHWRPSRRRPHAPRSSGRAGPTNQKAGPSGGHHRNWPRILGRRRALRVATDSPTTRPSAAPPAPLTGPARRQRSVKPDKYRTAAIGPQAPTRPQRSIKPDKYRTAAIGPQGPSSTATIRLV